MGALGEHLRKRFSSPRDALRALGIDDAVLAADSMENLTMKTSRLAALALSITAAHIAPVLAMDAQLPKQAFLDLKRTDFKVGVDNLMKQVKSALEGKTRKGMAFDEKPLRQLLDALGENVSVDSDKPLEEKDEKKIDEVAAVKPVAAIQEDDAAAAPKTCDAAAVKEWLTGKGVAGDALAEFDTMFGSGAPAATDEFPPKKDDDNKDKKDEKDDDKVSKQAMDSAISTAVTAAVKKANETQNGIRRAIGEVKPWIGEVPASMAFDSASGVYRHALTTLGIDCKDLHESALLPVLNAQQKPGAKAPVTNTVLGMDAAARDSMKSIIGVDLSRIGTA